ncbi:MAG: methylated-DNA--[protein]-cysteine S-methyltransferase [Desulfobacterales bacterium]|nr:methylated-DNA--[protein]-cysteine S-methyltransferase [Desulfobacterales bacterium]
MKKNTQGMNKKIIAPTPYGSVVIIWSATDRGPRIVRVLLSRPAMPAGRRASGLYPTARTASCAEVDTVASGIRGLLEGEQIEFSLDVAAMSSRGEFQQRVLRAEHAIPRGSVSTYKLIAAHLGAPGGARAVGNALASNPFPLIVPCHRAIRSDRGLGGYQGGPEMKRALLTKEGITFDSSGRVECDHFHYEK